MKLKTGKLDFSDSHREDGYFLWVNSVPFGFTKKDFPMLLSEFRERLPQFKTGLFYIKIKDKEDSRVDHRLNEGDMITVGSSLVYYP